MTDRCSTVVLVAVTCFRRFLALLTLCCKKVIPDKFQVFCTPKTWLQLWGPVITMIFYNWISKICFSFDLACRSDYNNNNNSGKVNYRAGICEWKSKTPNSARSLAGLHLLFFVSIQFRGVCPTRRGMLHETEAGSAHLHRVVDCSREAVGAAAAWDPTVPTKNRVDYPRRLKKLQVVANSVLRSYFFGSQSTRTSTGQVTTSLIISIYVSLSLLPAWGIRVAPQPAKTSQERWPPCLLAGAGKKKLPLVWPRRSGEDTGRRSPRWLPTSFRWPFFCVIRIL